MRKPSLFAALPGALLCLSSVGVTLTHISPAQAQEAADAAPSKETKAAARAAYGAGEGAYSEDDYVTAYEKFREANELIPSIYAEYWMAMSLAGLGKNAEAYEALSKVLDDPSSSKLGAEKLEAGNEKLAELQKMPASVAVTSEPPGAAIAVDGEVRGKTPGKVEVPPGAHQITLTLDGHEPLTVDVNVKPAEETSEEVTLIPLPAAKPEPEPAPAEPAPVKQEERSMVPAYITLGVAGASAIVGTIFGIQALGASSDFESNPTTESADDAERNALIADMAFGVTLTLGITGIVLLTADDDSELAAKAAPKARLQVAPYAGPKGGGAAARLTF